MRASKNYTFALLLAFAASVPSGAQQSGAQPPVKGMASTIGLYVYPQKNQSATQQLTDEQQCYNNAKSQTGYDPNATTTGSSKNKTQKSNDNDVAKGAARGAVISGATGGDARAGARRGAVIAGIREKREKSKDDKAQSQADAKTKAENQKKDDFKRATTACLGARGYSVR